MAPFDHLRVKEESLAVNTDFVDYEPAEELIRNMASDIRFGGDHAAYNPDRRLHRLPAQASLQGGEANTTERSSTRSFTLRGIPAV